MSNEMVKNKVLCVCICVILSVGVMQVRVSCMSPLDFNGFSNSSRFSCAVYIAHRKNGLRTEMFPTFVRRAVTIS